MSYPYTNAPRVLLIISYENNNDNDNNVANLLNPTTSYSRNNYNDFNIYLYQ